MYDISTPENSISKKKLYLVWSARVKTRYLTEYVSRDACRYQLYYIQTHTGTCSRPFRSSYNKVREAQRSTRSLSEGGGCPRE